MGPLNSATSSHRSSTDRGFFGKIQDTISDVLFPRAARDRELLNSFADWREKQKYNVSVETPSAEAGASTDPVENFLQVFLSNLAVKLFDTSVVDKIKTVISKGLTETLRMQVDTIIEFLVVESKTAPPDLKDPKSIEFLDQGIAYLLQYTEGFDDKIAVIRSVFQKIVNEAEQELTLQVDVSELARNNCSLEALRRYTNDEINLLFLKGLGKFLATRMVKNEKFGKAFEGGTFEALKPIVELVLKKQLPQISTTVKLFADMGSHLLGNRVSALYNSLEIPEVLDTLISKVNAHVVAYNKAKSSDFLKSFAEQEGCHEVAKAIINKSDATPRVLKKYFTEFSQTCVDYILDNARVEEFISKLGSIRGELLKGVTDPFAIELVNVLMKEENKPLLIQAIKALKPVIVPMIAEFLAKTGIKTIFPRDRIYNLVYSITEPIWDLMRRLIIERLVSTMLDDQEFITLFDAFDQQVEGSDPNDALINKVIQVYENTFNKTFLGRTTPIEQKMKDQIPASLQGLKKVLQAKLDCKTKLKDYFDLPFKTYGNVDYGPLIMNVVFGIPGGARSLAMNWKYLETLLGNIFQDGVAHLRCVESPGEKFTGERSRSNDLLIKLLTPAIEPFKNPQRVEELLQQTSNPWTEQDIKARTATESAILSDLLLKIIYLAPGGKVSAPLIDFAGLKSQLENVLNKLFVHNEVNYNLWFIVLDILQEQIKKAPK